VDTVAQETLENCNRFYIWCGPTSSFAPGLKPGFYRLNAALKGRSSTESDYGISKMSEGCTKNGLWYSHAIAASPRGRNFSKRALN